jgi:pimeloyl-ACP methyl ester carboxylesterase
VTACTCESRESDRQWFDRATAVVPPQGSVSVDGARIAYRTWGESSGSVLVLVHGSAAHSRWWDHMGPWLGAGRQVVALDLSGHGNSDHRRRYSRAQWADEVMAVAQVFGPRPIIVGHSLGGFVALEVGARRGDDVGGIIVVDSPVKETDAQTAALRERAERSGRAYADELELVDRFRALPEYRPIAPHLLRHLAQNSVRRVGDGYRWHFDPQVFTYSAMILDEVRPVGCPVAILRGDHGTLTPHMSRQLVQRLGPATVAFDIPDCGHSVMLDQPFALGAAVAALAGVWESY